jgi:hypothetical protein
MKNYEHVLPCVLPLLDTPEAGREVARQQWNEMGLFTVWESSRSFLENLITLYTVAVMRDGIVSGTFQSKLRVKKRHFVPYLSYYPWEPLISVTLYSTGVTFENSHSAGTSAITLSESDHARFLERWKVFQAHGDIPSTVTLIDQIPDEVRKKSPESVKRGVVERFFTRLREAAFFVFVVAVIAIGYPLYLGAGSLVDAVAPMAAEIAPDAVKLAIAKHPEWPFNTRFKLTTIADGLHTAPLHFLAEIFGIRQNKPEYLILVPIFWTMEFAPREKQVEWLAAIIEKDMERQPD